MVLVFGCRQSKIDHIYREETLQAKNKGVFRELYTAYSREPDKPKVTSGPCTVPTPQPNTCRHPPPFPEFSCGTLLCTSGSRSTKIPIQNI